MIFNPNRFTLDIRFEIDTMQYTTEINKERISDYSLEQLFTKILKKIKKYESNHILDDSDCKEKE